MTKSIDEQIEELIEWWDFQPHQNEDARWEANRKKIKSLITQAEKEARIDECVRSNSRLISIKKGFMTLREALQESYDRQSRLRGEDDNS